MLAHYTREKSNHRGVSIYKYMRINMQIK